MAIPTMRFLSALAVMSTIALASALFAVLQLATSFNLTIAGTHGCLRGGKMDKFYKELLKGVEENVL